MYVHYAAIFKFPNIFYHVIPDKAIVGHGTLTDLLNGESQVEQV